MCAYGDCVPTTYVLLITIGAVARVTRLVTWDSATQPLRDLVLYNREQRAARRAGKPLPAPARPRAALVRAWGHQLVTCVWCIGLWIAAVAVALGYTVGPHPALMIPAAALALSYVVGLLSGLEADRRATVPSPHSPRD